MFEGWVADLLASYLGHFVDVQRKALRLGLWSGLTLQGVQLRAEAFDFLRLPFTLKQGSIGRLQVRLPWGAFTLPNSFITISLDDVVVELVLREPDQFCTGGSGNPEEVELAASELDTLSGSPDAKEGGMFNRGFARLLEYVARFLIRRLKLSINNVQLRFDESSSGLGSKFEVALRSVHTRESAPKGRTSILPPLTTNALLAKELEFTKLCISWCCPREKDIGRPASLGDDSDRQLRHVLHPLHAVLRIGLDRLDGVEPRLSLAAQLSEVQVQVQDRTLCDIVRFADKVDNWTRLNRYAAYRPPRRPKAGVGLSWQPMWRYAFDAVCAGLTSRQMSRVAKSARHQKLRSRYIELYIAHLKQARSRGVEAVGDDAPVSAARHSTSAQDEGSQCAELKELESNLTIAHILLYRASAEQALQMESFSDSNAQASGNIGGMLGWGISRAASYVGYLPTMDGQAALPDNAIQELSSILQKEDMRLFESLPKHQSYGMRVKIALDVTRIHVAVQMENTDIEDIATIEAQQIKLSSVLEDESSVSLCATIHDVIVHDLCSDPGVSEILLARSGTPGFLSTLPKRSSFEAPRMEFEEHVPMIRVNYGESREGFEKRTASPTGCSLSGTRSPPPCVNIVVLPTVMVCRPTCVGRLMNIADQLGKVSVHASRYTSSAGRLETHACRTAAKADFLARSPASLGINIKFGEMAVVLPSFHNATGSGIMLQADGMEVQIANTMDPVAGAELISALTGRGSVALDAHPPSVFSSLMSMVEKLEKEMLLQHVDVEVDVLRAATINFGVCAEEILVPSRLSMSVAVNRLPPPATDVPLIRVEVSLGELFLRVPLCELDILQGIGTSMQHLQELITPLETDYSGFPEDALVSQQQMILRLQEANVEIEDDVKKCFPPGTSIPRVTIRLLGMEMNQQTQPLEHMLLSVRQLELSDTRSRYQGLRREAFPSIASYVSVSPIRVENDARDTFNTSLAVSLSGIAWSGYAKEECNFIQMCHKNLNLPAIAVKHSSRRVDGAPTSPIMTTVIKLTDLCVGVDLIPAVLSAFGVGSESENGDGNDGKDGNRRHDTPTADQEEASVEAEVNHTFEIELRQCEVALSAWDYSRASVSYTQTPIKTAQSNGDASTGPDYLLLHIPMAHLSLPVLGDKATEEHEIFSSERLALYCCINGLQASSPALLQLPQIVISERSCCLPSERGSDGHLRPSEAQQLDVYVKSLEACLSLQVLEPVVRIITSRIAELESSRNGGSQNGVDEKPNSRCDDGASSSRVICLGIAFDCIALHLRDDDGSTSAIITVKGAGIEARITREQDSLDISVTARWHRLDVLSELLPAIAPKEAIHRVEGMKPVWTMQSLQGFGSSQSLGLTSAQSHDSVSNPHLSEAKDVFDMEGSQDEQSPHGSKENPLAKSEEEEDEYQDAPEEFVSPSSSFRSSSGGVALMAWGRRMYSMETDPGSNLAQQASQELGRRLVLLSIGGPAEEHAPHFPGAAGVLLEVSVNRRNGGDASGGSSNEQTLLYSSDADERSHLHIAFSLSPIHTSMAMTGWDRSARTVQLAMDVLSKYAYDGGDKAGISSAKSNAVLPVAASTSSLDFAFKLEKHTAMLASRRFYAAEPCRLEGTTPHALPLLSIQFEASGSGDMQVGGSQLQLPVTASFCLSEIEVHSAVAVPDHTPDTSSIPVSTASGTTQAGCAEQRPFKFIDSGRFLHMADLQACVELRTTADLQIHVKEPACLVSQPRLELVNAWLLAIDRYSVPKDVGEPRKSASTTAKENTRNMNEFLRQLQALWRENWPLGLFILFDLDRLSFRFNDSGSIAEVSPLLEMWIEDVQWVSRGTLGREVDSIDTTLQATLCVEAYNVEKKGWESVLEPWTIRGRAAIFHPWRQWSSSSASTGIVLDRADMQRANISVGAESVLQTTFSAASSDVLDNVLEAFNTVFQEPQLSPELTTARLLHVSKLGSAHSGGYQLTNASGSTIYYWPVHTPTGKAVSSLWASQSPGLGGLADEHEQGNRSYRWAVRSSAKKELSSGNSCFISADNGSSDPGLQTPSNQLHRHRAHSEKLQRQCGTLLKFQLDGQVKPCAPVALESVGAWMMSAHLMLGNGGRVPVKVVADVQSTRNGGRNLVIHGTFRLVNNINVPLEVGVWAEGTEQLAPMGLVESMSFMWLPITSKVGNICIRPKAHDSHWYHWSERLNMPELLNAAPKTASCAATYHRKLKCEADGGSDSFCCWAGMVASEVGTREGNAKVPVWNVKIEPAMLLHNCLPVPVSIELLERLATGVEAEFQTVQVLHDLESLSKIVVTSDAALRASLMRLIIPGHHVSPPVTIEHHEHHVVDNARPTDASTEDDVEWSGAGCVVVLQPCSEVGEEWQAGGLSCGSQSIAGAAITVQQGRSFSTGAMQLRLACSTWVYNCTGLPLGVRACSSFEKYEEQLAQEEQMGSWVFPFRPSPHRLDLATQCPYSSPRPNSHAPTVSSISTSGRGMLSAAQLAANAHPAVVMLQSSSQHFQTDAAYSDIRDKSHTPLVTTVPWPGMLSSGIPVAGCGLQSVPLSEPFEMSVELSAGSSVDPEMWSSMARVARLGIPAVAEVMLPEWYAGEGTQLPPGSLQVALSIHPVEGGAGACALHIYPRYILYNALDKPLLWRQASVPPGHVCSLPPRTSTVLTWDYPDQPARVMVRVHEPSWDWSRGFDVNSPGDIFVKLRHHVRGETLLVGVGISASSGGCWVTSLTNDSAGFAPYRLDNCTSYTLQCRQLSSLARCDVLRPYCSLPYAWDDPNGRHELVVELPDGRTLGSFSLDAVGRSSLHRIFNSNKTPRDTLLLTVSAEGPTCVLQVSDLKLHSPLDHRFLSRQPGITTDLTSPGNSRVPEKERISISQSAERDVQRGSSHSAPFLTLSLEFPGVGLSVVGASSELMYVYTEDIRMELSQGWVSNKLEVTLGAVQVDNQMPHAIYPVVLCSPVRRLRMGGLRRMRAQPIGRGTCTSAAGNRNPNHAVSFQFLMWRRQSGGVACVEVLELKVGGLGLQVDERHVHTMLAFASEVLEPHLERLTAQLPETQQPKTAHLPDERLLALLRGDVLAAGNDPFKLVTERKIYLERLTIHPVDITLSFASATGRSVADSVLQRWSYLADMEDAQLRLRRLEMHHPLMRADALATVVSQHYSRALLPGLFRLLGSVGIFGQPLRNLSYVGLGVVQFLAGPAMGLAQSVQGQGAGRFAESVADGTGALLRGTVFALTNALSKWSASARKGLGAMGWTAAAGGSGMGGSSQGQPEGGTAGAGDEGEQQISLLAAVMRGVAGVLSDPVRGMDQRGLRGLLGGILTGVTGAVGHPAAEVLQISERISSSLRQLVSGSPEQLDRVRLPRYLPRGQALRPYRWLDAVGHALLPAIDPSRQEELLCCVKVAGGGGERTTQQPIHSTSPSPSVETSKAGGGDRVRTKVSAEAAAMMVDDMHAFAVLTHCSLSQLHVPTASIKATSAVVKWTIQLQDILLVSKEGCQLKVLSLTSAEPGEGIISPSGLVMGRQQALCSPARPRSRHAVAGRGGGDGNGRQSPVLQTCVSCCSEDGATELETELTNLLQGCQTVAADGYGTPTRTRSGGG